MTNPTPDRPLVTFALFAYNQEQYIREAVEGALTQTYSPLEIVIVDDCSEDGTARIIQELVSAYSGPHNINFLRSQKNLGLAEAVNLAMLGSSGELIIAAAGDDVSLPNRTAAIADFYLQNGRPLSIYSDYIEIDSSGNRLNASVKADFTTKDIYRFVSNPNIKGAAHSWSRQIFDVFGPLHKDVLSEDISIPIRSYLLDCYPAFLPEKLVLYRKYSNQMRLGKAAHFDRMANRLAGVQIQFEMDSKVVDKDLHSVQNLVNRMTLKYRQMSHVLHLRGQAKIFSIRLLYNVGFWNYMVLLKTRFINFPH